MRVVLHVLGLVAISCGVIAPAPSFSSTVTTFAGKLRVSGLVDGVGNAARMSSPFDMAFDQRTGNLWFADATSSNRLRTVDLTTRRVTTVVGAASGSANGPYVTAGIPAPYMTYMPTPTSCEMFISSPSSVLRRVDFSRDAVYPIAGGTPGYAEGTSSQAKFSDITSATTLPGDTRTLHLCDRRNHVLRAVDLVTMTTRLMAGTPQSAGYREGASPKFNEPWGLRIRPGSTTMWVSDYRNNVLRIYNPATRSTSLFAGRPGVRGNVDGALYTAQFYFPCPVRHHGGVVYVGQDHPSIRAIANGYVHTITHWVSGAADGPWWNARFVSTHFLEIDCDGNLYCGDNGNSAIRKIVVMWPSNENAGAVPFCHPTPQALPRCWSPPPFVTPSASATESRAATSSNPATLTGAMTKTGGTQSPTLPTTLTTTRHRSATASAPTPSSLVSVTGTLTSTPSITKVTPSNTRSSHRSVTVSEATLTRSSQSLSVTETVAATKKSTLSSSHVLSPTSTARPSSTKSVDGVSVSPSLSFSVSQSSSESSTLQTTTSRTMTATFSVSESVSVSLPASTSVSGSPVSTTLQRTSTRTRPTSSMSSTDWKSVSASPLRTRSVSRSVSASYSMSVSVSSPRSNSLTLHSTMSQTLIATPTYSTSLTGSKTTSVTPSPSTSTSGSAGSATLQPTNTSSMSSTVWKTVSGSPPTSVSLSQSLSTSASLSVSPVTKTHIATPTTTTSFMVSQSVSLTPSTYVSASASQLPTRTASAVSSRSASLTVNVLGTLTPSLTRTPTPSHVESVTATWSVTVSPAQSATEEDQRTQTRTSGSLSPTASATNTSALVTVVPETVAPVPAPVRRSLSAVFSALSPGAECGTDFVLFAAAAVAVCVVPATVSVIAATLRQRSPRLLHCHSGASEVTSEKQPPPMSFPRSIVALHAWLGLAAVCHDGCAVAHASVWAARAGTSVALVSLISASTSAFIVTESWIPAAVFGLLVAVIATAVQPLLAAPFWVFSTERMCLRGHRLRPKPPQDLLSFGVKRDFNVGVSDTTNHALDDLDFAVGHSNPTDDSQRDPSDGWDEHSTTFEESVNDPRIGDPSASTVVTIEPATSADRPTRTHSRSTLSTVQALRLSERRAALVNSMGSVQTADRDDEHSASRRRTLAASFEFDIRRRHRGGSTGDDSVETQEVARSSWIGDDHSNVSVEIVRRRWWPRIGVAIAVTVTMASLLVSVGTAAPFCALADRWRFAVVLRIGVVAAAADFFLLQPLFAVLCVLKH